LPAAVDPGAKQQRNFGIIVIGMVRMAVVATRYGLQAAGGAGAATGTTSCPTPPAELLGTNNAAITPFPPADDPDRADLNPAELVALQGTDPARFPNSYIP
jgi:hypothetical protein